MSLATILVEDSWAIRESLKPALEEVAGAQVVAIAETAAEAIAAVQRHGMAWQLIIVDLYLSGGTGLQVLRAVKDRGTHQHAIVLSNFATQEIRKRALKAGADQVFDKSLEIASFLDQCRTYSTE
jgi:DNA-binding NarL/FixJ family response regulator